MSEGPGAIDKRILYLVALVVVSAAIFGVYHLAIQSFIAERGHPPTHVVDVPQYETVDSSYCISCHTNEGIISLSTVGQDEGPAEDAGG